MTNIECGHNSSVQWPNPWQKLCVYCLDCYKVNCVSLLISALTLSILTNFIGLFHSLSLITLKQAVGAKGLRQEPYLLMVIIHFIQTRSDMWSSCHNALKMCSVYKLCIFGLRSNTSPIATLRQLVIYFPTKFEEKFFISTKF